MTLAGSRLGPYEVLTHIGSGGMGEVWRARDTKLARDVALKFLPESFANDADRLARFQREAQVLASLNHPNIAAIYGFEEGRALVLELVEGPTLADRIAMGPIPLEDAMPMARQIAEALEAAHAQGVIHRDLKPGNIKVRPDGTVKVLDFGLAKAFDSNPNASEASLSPTMTSPAMTRMGVIMGTAAYMSPEQARGSAVDSRADIWSFGVVLYEMLAGKTLFEGPTVSDTLAAVLRADLNWVPLPELTPAVHQLLRRCLQRDPKRRLQHIGDARIEIEEWQSSPAAPSDTPHAPTRWRLPVAAALLSAAAVGPLAWSFKPSSEVSGPPISFVIRTPSDAPVGRQSPLALSPDGRHLVYVAGLTPNGLLFHQSLDAFDPRPLESGRNATAPFFAPGSDIVGFFAGSAGELQQLRLTGGSATRLLDTPGLLGANWGDDGTIVLSPEWGAALRVVRPGTSVAADLTRLDVAAGERAHIWPQILPGNRAVLFTVWAGAPTWDEAKLAVADLETGRHTVVLSGGASGQYASNGHLVFWRGNALMAARFDLGALKVTGEPVTVVPDVRLDTAPGKAHFALSKTGTLVFVKGRADAFAEGFVAERSGRRVAKLDETEPIGAPTFSPDGKRVAMTLLRGGTWGIGVYDLERRLLTPIALAGDHGFPTWTRDGGRITFVSNAGGGYNHYSIPFDGTGTPEPLFTADQGYPQSPSAWSPDGRQLLYVKPGEKSGRDIWIHTPGQKTEPRSLIATAANESHPAFSPDGRFIAYQSDESGALEIYVRPFPQVDTRRELISRSGGTDPRWSRDGTEIFYLSEPGIMSVPVAYGRGEAAPLSLGQPSVVLAMTGLTSFDVSLDRTFVIERVPVERAAKEIHVVVNWFEELRRLVPAR